MTEAIETFAPWTIKSFSVGMRKEIVDAAAAHKPKMEVGAFLAMVWRAYVADGSPVQVGPAAAAPPEALAALATLADAARAMATAAGVAPPPALAKHLLALTGAQARAARGLRPRRVRTGYLRGTKALPAPG